MLRYNWAGETESGYASIAFNACIECNRTYAVGRDQHGHAHDPQCRCGSRGAPARSRPRPNSASCSTGSKPAHLGSLASASSKVSQSPVCLPI